MKLTFASIVFAVAIGAASVICHSSASAQSTLPTIPNGHVLGNATGAPAQAQDTAVPSLFDAACSTTVGQVWVRLSGGWGCTSLGYANPDWWGADPTGVTDSTAAFNSALATSNYIKLGKGKYRLTNIAYDITPSAGWTASSTSTNTVGTGTFTFTVQSGLSIPTGSIVTAYALNTFGIGGSMTGTVTSYSGTTLVINATSSAKSGTYSGWNIVQNYLATGFAGSLTIEGAGADATTLYFPGSNGFNINYHSQQHAIHFRGFSITTGSTDPGATRAAILLRNFYPFFGTFVAQSDIRDVTCRGDDGYAATNYWGYCVLITNVSDVTLDNFNSYGDGTGSHGTGIYFINPGAGCFSSPTTCGTVYNISNSNFSFLGAGVVYGANTQTVQITNSFFAQSQNGIVIPASGGTLQGLNVSNSTCFTIGQCIVGQSSLPNMIVTGNFLNAGVNGGTPYYAIDVLSSNMTINGNNFIPRGGVNSSAGGIKIAAGSNGATTITGNTFSSVGQAIFLTSGTGLINVQSNAYTGNTGTVLNTSGAACPATPSANCVGGGSQ